MQVGSSRLATLLALGTLVPVLAPREAHAQVLGRLSLHIEAGVGSMLSGRQQTQLDYGLAEEGTLRASLRFAGPLALQLSMGHWMFPSDHGQGYVTTFTAGLRLQGRVNRRMWLFADANVGPVVTGGDARTGFDMALGGEFAVTRGFSIGPFGRAGIVFATASDAPSNAVTLVAGLSGSIHFSNPRPPPPPPPPAPPPPPDSDGDGLDDTVDRCPTQPPGEHPDTAHPGCPLPDADHDGIPDADDRCPNEAPGEHPDPERHGCPEGDRDHDGVLDHDDQCPDRPQGRVGIEGQPGCPAPDRDGDAIPDPVDHCPEIPGAPSANPEMNGCPAQATLIGDQIQTDHPVGFTSNEDAVLTASEPVLQSIADVIVNNPSVTRVSIEGHWDRAGNEARTVALTQHRADLVMAWLVEHGVPAARLEAHGYGSRFPAASNMLRSGRLANRRMEFHLVSEASPAR